MSKPAWADGLLWPEAESRPQRIERIAEAFTIRGMIIESAVSIVRREVSPAAAAEVLSKAGVRDGSLTALRNYPLRQFMELQTLAAQRLMPRLGSLEAAVARTGAAAVEFFFDSIAGRTMKVLAGTEPHRLLSAAPNGYSLAIHDDGRRDYLKTGERSGIFAFENDILGPSHQIGTFLAAIQGACGLTARIAVEQSTHTNFKLLVSW